MTNLCGYWELGSRLGLVYYGDDDSCHHGNQRETFLLLYFSEKVEEPRQPPRNLPCVLDVSSGAVLVGPVAMVTVLFLAKPGYV